MEQHRSVRRSERVKKKRQEIINVRSKLPLRIGSSSSTDDLANQFNDTLSTSEGVVSVDQFTSRDMYYDMDSYHRVHEQLLKDREYVSKWHSAICNNSHLFKDKIVLDVRCGLGLLSMFAAVAGAKHVYAIDKSNVVQLARRIVHDNGLANRITILHGSANNIELPVDKVDIIISTCFVSSIYYENSFDEIVVARDKWLIDDGLMFPDRCSLYIMAMEDKSYSQQNMFWHNVYSFDMSVMYETVNKQPGQARVATSDLFTTACQFKLFDFYAMTRKEWNRFGVGFRLKAERNAQNITALMTFFELEFTKCHTPITISCRPESKLKHWSPTIFYLNSTEIVPVEADDVLYGTIVFNARTERMKEKIRIGLCYRNANGFLQEKFCYEFR